MDSEEKSQVEEVTTVLKTEEVQTVPTESPKIPEESKQEQLTQPTIQPLMNPILELQAKSQLQSIYQKIQAMEKLLSSRQK